MMPTMPTKSGSHKTLLLIVLLLILFLIAGAFVYLRSGTSYVDNTETYSNTASETADTVTESLNVQSNSDEIDAIETDLNNTDIDSIGIQ